MGLKPPTAGGGEAMKKKSLKKLQLHRETLACLEMVKGGKDAAAGGTHYRSLCIALCEDTDTPTVVPD
jgi:hypothetical protein